MKVTYFNPMTGKRHDLIEDISAEDAQKVRDKFSDKSQPRLYLEEVRVETDEGVPV